MARPKRDWRTNEADLSAHEYGMCRNGRGGLGCADCEPGHDDDPEGGNAWPDNLAGVERVTFIPAH